MSNEASRLRYLLSAFHDRTASRQELEELMQLLSQQDIDAELNELWQHVPREDLFFSEETSEQLLQSILRQQEQYPAEKVPARSNRKKWLAAAALVISFSIAGYFLFSGTADHSPVKPAVSDASSIIMPGGDKAVLTLEDGSAIVLDGTGNGNLATQGNTNIMKIDGQVIYSNATAKDLSRSLTFNTLTTPKGGQFQLTLADGTKVWMNAASSLRYPTNFTGDERIVELKGEAYFEVAKNPSKPFRVLLPGMNVEVLGTHFNIMAYENESTIKTTLLEGAVKVNSGAYQASLLPGQQAELGSGKGFAVMNEVDLEQVVAWKNGYFQFNRDGLDVVMRQIERWYDVSVGFEGSIPDRQFGGKISRSSNIDDVLRVLELSKVSFRIEGKKIIVTNKP